MRISRKPWTIPGFDIYSQQTYKKLRIGYKNHKGEFVPPQFTKGCEWDYLSPRACYYNLDLLESFIKNRDNPKQHQKNIRAYFASQTISYERDADCTTGKGTQKDTSFS